jgi:hypothetical protein
LGTLRWKLFAAAGMVGLLLAPAAPAQEGKAEGVKPKKIAPAPGGQPKQPTEEELIGLRDKKLQAEFLKKADWITDYDKAREAAKSGGKLIFGYFTRSYAY